MESVLHADGVRSGHTTDTTIVPAHKIHNNRSNGSIALKGFNEFPEVVFHGVAWDQYCTQTASDWAIPPTRREYRLKRSITIDPTVRSRSKFLTSFRGCFPWGCVESVLHADGIRKGHTAVTNRVSAQKVHNYRSDPLIALKLFHKFPEAIFHGVACNQYYMQTTSSRAIPPTQQEYRLKRSITIDPTVGSRSNVFSSSRRLFSMGLCGIGTTSRRRPVGPYHRHDDNTGSKDP